VHDYLKTVTLPGVVDKVLLGGNKLFQPRYGEVYMPLEFSVAAYRFGHSMVRGFYDYNRNFGRKNGGRGAVRPFATFEQIFAFTGSARPEPFSGTGTPTLPHNWEIEWGRFVDKGDSQPDHFARRIDTQLALPLFDMINQVSEENEGLPEAIKDILKRLAVRNLLRGYQLALPTGQAVADALGVRRLSSDELRRGNSDEVNDALGDGGFLETTPLWFYVLKEAEVGANGNSLGEVGSRIVVETLIGQLRADPGPTSTRMAAGAPSRGCSWTTASPSSPSRTCSASPGCCRSSPPDRRGQQGRGSQGGSPRVARVGLGGRGGGGLGTATLAARPLKSAPRTRTTEPRPSPGWALRTTRRPVLRARATVVAAPSAPGP